MQTTVALLLCCLAGLPLDQELKLSRSRALATLYLIANTDGLLDAEDDKIPDEPDTPAPDDDDGKCPCRGTKKVRSGDGLVEVPCPCGRKCRCSQGTAPEPVVCNCPKPCPCGSHCRCKHSGVPAAAIPTLPVRHSIYFGAVWCGYCAVPAASINKLKAAGHDIGTDAKCLLQTVDLDAKGSDALVKEHNIGGIPTLLVFENGVEIQRFVGINEIPKDPFAIAEVVYGTEPFLSPTGKQYHYKAPPKPGPATAAAPAAAPAVLPTISTPAPMQYFYYPPVQYQYRRR